LHPVIFGLPFALSTSLAGRDIVIPRSENKTDGRSLGQSKDLTQQDLKWRPKSKKQKARRRHRRDLDQQFYRY
jgi:hypothetical protein